MPRLLTIHAHSAGRVLTAALLAGALSASAGDKAAEPPKLASTLCASCHGPDGNSVIPIFPNLAGQQEDYLVKQLRDFQSGRRKSNVMAPVVASLSLDDIATLSQFYSRQKVKLMPSAQKRAAAFGKLIYLDGDEETGVPACIGCHKLGGKGQELYPRIGGQHPQYMTQQLRSFASGDRTNDVSRFMQVLAKRMTEEELLSVAEYLAGVDAK